MTTPDPGGPAGGPADRATGRAVGREARGGGSGVGVGAATAGAVVALALGAVLLAATLPDPGTAYVVFLSGVLGLAAVAALVGIVLVGVGRALPIGFGLLVGSGLLVLAYLPLAYAFVIITECGGSTADCML